MLDDEGADKLQTRCRTVCETIPAELLDKHSSLRHCFERNELQDGLTIKESQLRKALAEWLVSHPDLRGVPRKAPLDGNGRVDLWPDRWGVILRCDPTLRAWADYRVASTVGRQLLTSVIVRPQYYVVPEIRSQSPNLASSRRLTDMCFVPKDGCVFVVGELRDLELRCCAVALEFAAGTPVRFANGFRDGRDPVTEAAGKLLDVYTGNEELDPTQSLDAHDPDCARAAQRAGPKAWFARLDEVTRFAVTRRLLVAVLAGLWNEEVLALLNTEFPDTLPARADIDLLLRVLLSYVCPEWGRFVEDPTEDVVMGKIGVSSRTLREHINITKRNTLAFGLRNIIRGATRHPVLRERWEDLLQASPNPDVRSMPASNQTYERIMRTNPIGPTGQVGAPVYWPQRLSAESQQLMDAVMKTVLYRLVGFQLDLVAVAEHSFVIEVPVTSNGMAERATSIANEAARAVLGDVARECCVCRICERW